MPSKRKQVMVRVTEEDDALAEQIRAAMREALGVEVSQSDLYRAGLLELRKRYLDDTAKPPKPPKRP